MNLATISETNDPLPFDLNKLLNTRLLIQANSGAGKSFAIRKLLEETHGKVQHIVLDMEGEFSSLREKYDYVLVGKGENVDVQINIKSAELLARKILSLNVSTIIDLYELKQHERVLFVKRFLDSLVNAPKKLWHPVLVLLDEAHNFCPQSTKCESTGSVIDLCTRGRKRGYCVGLATQRISKLHKDSAAECNNKIIGRTGMDIDMKRAGEELGFTSKEDVRNLRLLKAGEFYAFGPAFVDEVTKVKINPVKTTHPDQNQRIGFTASPPTPKIKAMLSQLANLPQQAEEELREKHEYVKKINQLKREIRTLNLSKPEVDKNSLNKAREQGIRIGTKIQEGHKQLIIKEYRNRGKIYKGKIDNLSNEIKRFATTCGKLLQVELPEIKVKPISIRLPKPETINEPVERTLYNTNPVTGSLKTEEEKPLGLCAKKIYGFLCANDSRSFTKVQIGAMTGYSHKSGGFSNAIYSLNSRDLIIKEGNDVSINVDNLDLELTMKGEVFSIDLIKNKLSKCPRELFEVLLEYPDQEFTKEELAEATPTQYSSTSGGFSNAVYKLNSLGFITKIGNRIKLHPDIEEIHNSL